MDQPPPPYPGGPSDAAYPPPGACPPGEKGGPPGQGYSQVPQYGPGPPPPMEGFAPPPTRYPPPPGGYPPPPGGGYPPGAYPPPPGAYPPTPGQPGYAQVPQYGPVQPGYPAGGMPPPGPRQPVTMGGPTVIVQQPGVTTLVQQFRESPVQTMCPHCSAQIVTGMQYETGTFTWLICALLCLVGCDGGCCLIPFCVDGCKDVVHTCPNCQRPVSRYNRL